MPAVEHDTGVAEKKSKKDKKNKKAKQVEEAEEEQVVEEPVAQVEENGNEHKKKKKKNKHKEEEVEEAKPQEEEEEEAEAVKVEAVEQEEEEEPVIKKHNKKNQNQQNESVNLTDDSKVNDVVKSLDDVSEELIEQFKTVAEKVVKKHKNDPVVPLAAAIAILSGATKVATQSLLTQREGFTTYQLTKYDDEIRGKSFAFVIVKRILGEEEGDAAVSHLTFTADRKSLVFDIPSSYDDLIQEKWYNTKSLEMKPLGSGDTLPALEENSRGGGGGGGGGGFGRGRGGGGGGRGGFGGRGGGGGGRGGFGGRGGGGDRGGRGGRGGFGGRGGGGGGFKRDFESNGGGGNNKKIKFDDDE